jgi:hypothetical protein
MDWVKFRRAGLKVRPVTRRMGWDDVTETHVMVNGEPMTLTLARKLATGRPKKKAARQNRTAKA